MRRIINSTFITLDGVIANPHTWPSGRIGGQDRARKVPETGAEMRAGLEPDDGAAGDVDAVEEEDLVVES